jgi:hypothetical protein
MLMHGGIMLQRYNITRDDQTNQLSIKEFAVLETKSRKRNDYKPDRRDYSLIHEVSYNSDIIRAAIKEGPEVLISELRTRDFFPIYPCIELIADNVIALFNGNSESVSEMFFDDRSLLSSYEEEQE